MRGRKRERKKRKKRKQKLKEKKNSFTPPKTISEKENANPIYRRKKESGKNS